MSIFSLASSSPLIDIARDLVRFARKYVEHELNLFSIIYPCRFLVLLEIIIELDFWFVHRFFTRHKTESEKT